MAAAGADLRRRPLAHLAQLATAIDDAFARWDRAHLHECEVGDALLTGPIIWDEVPEHAQPSDQVRLSRLGLGDQFVYTFDLGDDWTHLCTVGPARIDPDEALGIVPDTPLPYWGWGAIPDQYGREFDGDDGETDLGADPDFTDLPALRPHWHWGAMTRSEPVWSPHDAPPAM